MIDLTSIVPLDSLSENHLGKTLQTEGIIQQNNNSQLLVEPPEYSSSKRFRLNINVSLENTEEDPQDGAYILCEGELKSNAENPSYSDITLHIENCTVFNTIESEETLSVNKTASVIMDIFEEFGTGAGVPKRFVIEQAKLQDASYETTVETINRLKSDGQLFEPKTGFISQL